jgi:hypothetical protein
MVTATRQNQNNKPAQSSSSRNALVGLMILMVIGLAAIVVYAFPAGDLGAAGAVFGTGAMIAGAAVMIGGFLGFLFGIPRTLQNEVGDQRAETEYRANTNLEQISDWLTKILVGVGLTQLSSVPEGLQGLGIYLQAAFGDRPGSGTFGLTITLYFLVAGFLFGFLWTRLFLQGAFREVDRELVAAVQQVEARIQGVEEQLEKQSELDARALQVAQLQLEPRSDTRPPTETQLFEAIKQASPLTRTSIFEMARSVRKRNWNVDKKLMAVTIPVFKALIQCDPDEHDHQPHGQLGFALKDLPRPDYKEAEALLSKAIDIRGAPNEEGYLFYEFNRAICTIMQNPDFTQGKATADSATREKIMADLRTSVSELEPLRPPVKEIAEWMKLNQITFADLRQ